MPITPRTRKSKRIIDRDKRSRGPLQAADATKFARRTGQDQSKCASCQVDQSECDGRMPCSICTQKRKACTYGIRDKLLNRTYYPHGHRLMRDIPEDGHDECNECHKSKRNCSKEGPWCECIEVHDNGPPEENQRCTYNRSSTMQEAFLVAPHSLRALIERILLDQDRTH